MEDMNDDDRNAAAAAGGTDDESLDHVPGDSVKVIAQTVGIENLSDEVARALAPDVEYRLREVIQDACKFMRHSKRTELSTEDVNCSLKLRNVEPLYGFPAGAGPISFKEVPGQPGLFYQEQTEIKLQAGGRGVYYFHEEEEDDDARVTATHFPDEYHPAREARSTTLPQRSVLPLFPPKKPKNMAAEEGGKIKSIHRASSSYAERTPSKEKKKKTHPTIH